MELRTWLKGIKTRQKHKKRCIQIKRDVYRNDRGTLGGGVFVLVEKLLTSVEQPKFYNGRGIKMGKNQIT